MFERGTEAGGALRRATIAGDIEVVAHLLQAGILPDSADGKGFTPLMLAAKRGHTAIATILLAQGASVFRVNEANGAALKYAVEGGSEEIIERLLEAGSNPDGYNPHTLLDIAVCRYGDNEKAARIVRLLLRYGANPNQTTEADINSLLSAAIQGRAAVLRELITGGARFRNRESYESALIYHRVRENPEMLALLKTLEPDE